MYLTPGVFFMPHKHIRVITDFYTFVKSYFICYLPPTIISIINNLINMKIVLDISFKICYTSYMNFINEEICPPKTYNRWPTKHRNQQFGDRLELYVSMCKNEEDPNTGFFLHSRYYYIRAALETKFNRNFTKAEITRIINDKSWQTA